MTVPTLPKFIPITEAVRKTHLSEKSLRSMLHAGKISGGTMNGELLVDANTLPTRKEDLPEYKKYTRLKGVSISLSEAARKYEIHHSTLHRWTSAKYIGKVGKDKNRILLNEQDVAYCAEIYHRNKGKGKQGKTLFNPDGTPYNYNALPKAS